MTAERSPRDWRAPTGCAGSCGPGLRPLFSPLAMSRPESLLRYWLLSSPLPDPQPQVPIHDRWGRIVAHGDLGYQEWSVLLEYEGRQHADVEQFGRDVDRYSLMGADGWLILRFAARHVGGPTVVVERTRRALSAAAGGRARVDHRRVAALDGVSGSHPTMIN